MAGEDAGGADTGKYKEKLVKKTGDIYDLLFKVVKESLLFKKMNADEKQDCIDAFFKVEVQAGKTVIKQGENGDNFYVVQNGLLTFSGVVGGNTMEFGDSGAGKAFGELALMYNTPRAATVTAKGDCVLWALDRATYRAISTHFKQLKKKRYMGFLKQVTELKNLKTNELGQLAEALEEEMFEKNDIIIREGEVGDHFYIIESGEVKVTKTEGDNNVKELTTLTTGKYFGEKALLSEDRRQATCTATCDTRCLSMERTNFVDMLGHLQDLIDRPSAHASKEADVEVDAKKSQYFVDIQYKDLKIMRTLGCGAFGRVKLVKHTATGKTYALKCLVKQDIVQNNLQEHVMNERNVMLALDHQFILKLHNTYKDSRYLYFLLELALGGELFTFLRKAGRFNEKASRFYASAVVLAFQVMHEKSIIYRDLKPENLILDSNGYLKVVDFGLAKYCTDKSWTLCGTPDYLAPEIILSKGHNKGVDYWSLGVLIYEMSAGFVPFYSDDPMEVYQLILGGDLKFPSHMSRAVVDLIQKLMNPNQGKRLGNMKGGIKDIIKHKWFSGYDWDGLLGGTLTPPIEPVIRNPEVCIVFVL
jgi:CRP-like cAMP-binding protein